MVSIQLISPASEEKYTTWQSQLSWVSIQLISPASEEETEPFATA